jgi:Domain of unknown function (DUF4826)
VSGDDYDDPEVEAHWLVEQRCNVQRYLDAEGVQHGGVDLAPAWFIAPYVSVWTVRSVTKASAVGWWAISGDLPTDYLSGNDATDPRRALNAFSRRWQEVARYMDRGEDHPTIKIGDRQNGPALGDLLMRRAQIIHAWVQDENMW